MELSVGNCCRMVSRKLLWNGQKETVVEWSVENCCGIVSRKLLQMVSRKLLWNGQ